jgi:outer membrane protein assembly complex protein YaeT
MKIRSKGRRVLIACGAFLLLLPALAVVLRTQPVKRYILAKAAAYLRSKAGIEFAADRLDYSFLPLQIRLSRCSLSSAAQGDLPPFFTAQHVSFRLSLTDLFRGTLPVHGAEITGAAFRVLIAAGARNNLPSLPSTARSAPPPSASLLLPSLRITDASFLFEDQPHQLSVTLPRWTLWIEEPSAQDRPSNIRFETVQEGRLTLNGAQTFISRIFLESEMDGAEARIRRLAVDAATARIAAQGKIALSDARLNLKVDGVAILDELESFLKWPPALHGRLDMRGEVTGTPLAPDVAGEVTGDGLSAFGYKNLVFEAHPNWSGSTGILDIGTYMLHSGIGSIEGSARIAMTGPQPSRLRANLAHWDVRTITEELRLPLQLASLASGSLTAEWTMTDFAGAAGKAEFRLEPQRAQIKGNLVPLAASFGLAREAGRTRLRIAYADAPGVSLRGDITLAESEALAGDVELNVSDLGIVSEYARGILAEGPSAIPFPLGGSVRLGARAGGSLSRPEFQIALDGRQVRAGPFHDIALAARFDADTSRILFQDVRASWGMSTLHAGGSLSLDSSPPALAIRARVDSVSLAESCSALGADIPVAGTLAAQAEISGPALRPDADAEIDVRGLQAYGETFGDLRSSIKFSGGRIELTNLSLETDEGAAGLREALAAHGYYDLKSGRFEMLTKAHSLELHALTLPGGVPVRGSLSFEAGGSGSLSEPDLTGSFNVRDFRMGAAALGRLQSDVRLRGSLAEVKLQAPDLNLAASANVTLKPPYPTGIVATAEGTVLDRLGIDVAPGAPLRGSVTGRISASGSIEEWQKAQGTAEIRDLEFAVGKSKINNEGALHLDLRDGILTLGDVALLAGRSHLRAAGKIPLTGPETPGSLRVAGRVDLADIGGFLVPKQDASLDGTLDLDLRFEGSRNAMRASGSAGLREGALHSSALPLPITQARADLRIQNGLLLLDNAQGRLGDGTIRSHGQLPLGLFAGDLPFGFEAAYGTARLTADLVDLPVSAIPQVPAGVNGIISLHLDAEAVKPELNAVKAELRFDKLDVAFNQYRLTQPSPSAIALDDGRVRIRQFALSGPGTELSATGSAALMKRGSVDLKIRGRMNGGLLTYFSRDLSGEGTIEVQVDVGRDLSDPRLSGYLESKDALLAIRSPRLQISDLNFRIGLDGPSLSIERLKGRLNGGSLEAAGGLKVAGGGITDVDIKASARDVFLDFPAGLRSALDADLAIQSQNALIVVGGSAQILEGAYRESLDLQGEVLRFLRSDQTLNLGGEPDPFLSRIRYRMRLENRNPVLVDNNLAKLALDANLDLTGTYYRPVVTGRITLEEGGEITLGERKYIVDRGTIDLQNPLRIEPTLDLLVKTKVGSYDIDLQVSGTPDRLTSSLTSPSDPDLTEPDIVSLLLTGRTLEEAKGAQLNVAKEQALSYLVGYAGGAVSRQVQETLGLSQVRVEPNLISPESEPGARLTVGEDITAKFQLVYSMNLANSQDQIWIAEFKPASRLDTRATRQSDGSFRFDLRHDLLLGKTRTSVASAHPRPRLTIGPIEFLGNTLFPEAELKRKLSFSTGDRYDFFKIRKGADRLEQFYSSHGYLEAQLRLDRQEKGREVEFDVHVDPGPKVTLDFQGMSPSGDLSKRIRQAWDELVFDQQRAAEAIRLIREDLARDRYLQPVIRYDIEERPEAGEKNVTFRITPGVQYRRIQMVFDGASAIPPSKLQEIIAKAGHDLDVYTAPEAVADFLHRVYRNEGYLDARVDPPALALDPEAGTGKVTIHIQEGPRYEFAGIAFKGNAACSDAELAAAIAPFSGQPYRAESVGDALAKLQDLYWRRGFNDVAINYAIERRQSAPLLDIEFQITENKQQVVERITVEGANQSGDDFARSRLTFAPNRPLDYITLNQSRKRLYDTGAYAVVDMNTVEIREAGANQPPPGIRPVEVKVALREVKPYRFNYGGFYDTERGPGGIAAFTRWNFLGAGRQLGFQGRYDGEIHEVRGFFGQPFMRNFPLKTSATVYVQREINPTFLTDRTGFSLQQDVQFRGRFVASYGYRYEKTHTFDKVPDPLFPFDITLPVARLSASLTRDVRDDMLAATRGSFTSHTFEYAPKALGSEIRFIRYFGQYFRYFPLSRPEATGGAQKPARWVYATAVRLGLAKGLGGQSLVPSERFFAGGATTVRGFEADSLGPVDYAGSPAGGDAMFVLNNEIRFPVVSVFDGVGFLDLGNVYHTLSDFNPFRVRKTAGLGLRVRTPFLLLRLDYGFILDRKPGEGRGKLYFSLGQAF